LRSPRTESRTGTWPDERKVFGRIRGCTYLLAFNTQKCVST
jgi:hypothetical protein